ncbi:MAG: 5-methyltetrahydrofolate--homocysteine methyltransferase [Chloroflexota bacterium]|jgi:5-methyltetrahydrofolate--homocysteine methyltransferase|nr:5-methyltetrahydrofolate--homocysteine methyltransferase [Chloroflexota bacterium]
MPSALLNALRDRVLVLDGAMGTAIHDFNLPLSDFDNRENCCEILVDTRPDVIQNIHESYLAAGCDVIETDTFGGMPHVLVEFALEDRCRELNREAVRVARAAAARYSTPDKPRFVLGSMGPGTKLISLGQITWDAMYASYAEQVRGLLDGGPTERPDGLLIETSQDLLQCKCAVTAAADVQRELGIWDTDARVPIFVQVTVEATGTMLLGSDIATALTALERLPIVGIGLNCATGPREMVEHIRYLSRHSSKLLTVVPNAGLPVMEGGTASFPLTPQGLATAARQFVEEDGVNMVGGCCGTTQEHLHAVVEVIGGRAPRARQPEPVAQISSLYNAVDLRQENSVLMIGERTNANGSKRFREMLAEEDWDGLVSWARTEVRGGSHVLDVCVDYVGRNGASDMHEVASRYVQQVSVPLVLDSTQADVLLAGLRVAGGKCIVNSINFEDGERRLEEVCPLIKQFGAAVIALTIDEEGMAKTADRKLAIAERLYQRCTETYGIDPHDILFDPLTFTICTGNEDDRRLALETLEGIELIARRLPECGILLGLSNVSFGLKPAARQVLNSVMLHEAQERGLTAAILHASGIRPRHRIPEEHWQAALDLIYDRRREGYDPLLSYLGLFPDDAPPRERVAPQNRTIEDTLREHIVDGEKRDLDAHLAEAMERYTPLEIINDHLLGGMKIVGELFGSGQMQLPFVLQSAEVMKQAVSYLEPYMERIEGQSRGKLVLATVKGDVHDIGKNLVDIILTNNGYQVFNLGIKQPIGAIIDAWTAHGADAIGMSGLLVKSVGVMKENLEELNARGISVPVLVGGAALTRPYAETELRNSYEGRLYYGNDAFEGLRIMQAIAEGRLGELDAEIDERVHKRAEGIERAAAQRAASPRPTPSAPTTRSIAPSTLTIPQPPFWGSRVVQDIPLQRIYAYIDRTALFRGQWGFKQGSLDNAAFERLLEEEAEPILKRLAAQAISEGFLEPALVYGYFPVGSVGDELIVFDPVEQDREIERFAFPRQQGGRELCIADFFLPADSGRRDVLGMFSVTMGREPTRRAQALFESNAYTEYLYLHGLGVACAEALAELWHQRMRQELGIDAEDAATVRELFQQKFRGGRYSFGYAACPDMSDQAKLFRLLQPERIGCELTENWQIDPEQSTSAIVCHHPDAKYFNA